MYRNTGPAYFFNYHFFEDIFDEHIQEAINLWCLHSSAVNSQQYNLESLRKVESRLYWHLTGLLNAPKISRQLRSDLWGAHTRSRPSNDVADEYARRGKVMVENNIHKDKGELLNSSLIEFFDGKSSRISGD